MLVDTAALDTQLTTLAGNPVVFALEAGTGDLVGKDGSTEVIRIHITGASLTNAATGEVSYTYSTTLSQPIKHASLDGQAGDNSENSALLSGVTFEVTDKDTDTTQGTFSVTIVDDVPSISAPGASATLTVDETDLATNATASFAGAFTSSFGADGAGTITYALGVVAGPSGLVDTATGQAVNLVLNGARRRRPHRDQQRLLVFTVTRGRRRQCDARPAPGGGAQPTNDPNEPTTLSADNLVTLTATITDKDGDSATATQNIGQNLMFLDDGPSDQRAGLEPDADGRRDQSGDQCDARALRLRSRRAFGADGAGTITYALGVVAGPSGLVDTATGEAVNLVAERHGR